jgi:alpha-N-arabinofuranosidase
MLGRREFLHRTLAGAGLVLASKVCTPFSWAESSGAESRIEVLTSEPLGTISPNIYGHFAENLSGVIYDGIWVGPNSKVPNIDGIRKDLIDEMRKIKAPVVRFPGGCFADSYDWREQLGAGESSLRSQRIRHQ